MRSTAHSSPSCETAAKECCLDDLDPPGSIWLRRMDAANALHMLSQSFSKTHELVTQIKDAKEMVVLLRVFTAEQTTWPCRQMLSANAQISNLLRYWNTFSLTLPLFVFLLFNFPGACGRWRRHQEWFPLWNLSKTIRHSVTLLVHGLHKFSQRSAIARSRQALSYPTHFTCTCRVESSLITSRTKVYTTSRASPRGNSSQSTSWPQERVAVTMPPVHRLRFKVFFSLSIPHSASSLPSVDLSVSRRNATYACDSHPPGSFLTSFLLALPRRAGLHGPARFKAAWRTMRALFSQRNWVRRLPWSRFFGKAPFSNSASRSARTSLRGKGASKMAFCGHLQRTKYQVSTDKPSSDGQVSTCSTFSCGIKALCSKLLGRQRLQKTSLGPAWFMHPV